MAPSSVAPTAPYAIPADVKSPARLPGHLAVPVIVGLALLSWIVVWQLVEAVAMVIDALH
jgi:hypothetical protein